MNKMCGGDCEDCRMFADCFPTKSPGFRYCLEFWRKNDGRMRFGELDYYQGKTGKHPHGIADCVWSEAYQAFVQEQVPV